MASILARMAKIAAEQAKRRYPSLNRVNPDEFTKQQSEQFKKATPEAMIVNLHRGGVGYLGSKYGPDIDSYSYLPVSILGKYKYNPDKPWPRNPEMMDEMVDALEDIDLGQTHYKKYMTESVADRPIYVTRNGNLHDRVDMESVSVVDPEDIKSYKNPYWLNDDLPNNIFKVEPGDKYINTLNLGDKNEMLIRHEQLEKLKRMPVKDYIDLISAGAAPWALGGVGISQFLSEDDNGLR